MSVKTIINKKVWKLSSKGLDEKYVTKTNTTRGKKKGKREGRKRGKKEGWKTEKKEGKKGARGPRQNTPQKREI